MGEEETRIEVRIIEQRGESALVQWRVGADLRRAYVPAEKVEGGACDAETLELGIPHGAPWEELVDVGDITPEAIARELRARGIWTLADLRERDRQLIRIGTNMVGQAVWNAARAHEKRGGK